MSTKSLIDDIARYASGWSRSQIRALIQKGQDRLFTYDSPYSVYLGTDNEGWTPYLYTVAGTYKYALSAANLSCGAITRTLNGTSYPTRAKKVLKVFVDATNIDYGKRWVGQPYLFAWQNPYTTAYTRLEVADMAVDSWPATLGQDAFVIFKEDPGTSTNKYFIRFTWEPVRLTADTIPLSVPDDWEEALEDYVMGTIQKRQNGKQSDRLTKFEGFWLNQWKTDSSLGAQTSTKQTRPRFC